MLECQTKSRSGFMSASAAGTSGQIGSRASPTCARSANPTCGRRSQKQPTRGRDMPLNLKCPKCGSDRIRLYGKRRSGYHFLQMYQCGACGKTFSERVLAKILGGPNQPEPSKAVMRPEAAAVAVQPAVPTATQHSPANLEALMAAKLEPIRGVCPHCGGHLNRRGFDKRDPECWTQRYVCLACHKGTITPKAEA